MKIYTYDGNVNANIPGDRIHQAFTAQWLSQDTLVAKLQLIVGHEAVSPMETGPRFVNDNVPAFLFTLRTLLKIFIPPTYFQPSLPEALKRYHT